MKKLLTFFLVALLTFSVSWARTYSYTLLKGDFTAPTQAAVTLTLANVDWALSGTPVGDPYLGNVDGTKGLQFGTANSPYSELSLSTTGISGTIQSITVNASTARSASATLSVTVGGVSYINYSLTTSSSDYTSSG